MKRFASLFFAFVLSLPAFSAIPAPSYDFCEQNRDGVMLYYRIIEDGYCELTYGREKYSGVINVPSFVQSNNVAVVGVGPYTFCECDDLIEVYLPHTVVYLDAVSFWQSRNLKKVLLDENLYAIGELAFEGCLSLSEINIPNSLEYMGYLAFNFCNKLGPLYNDRYFFYYQYPSIMADTVYRIPDGIEIINTSAFSFSSFTEVIIPNSVTTIMDNAFDGSTIRRVTIPPSVTILGNKAFGQSGLREVTVPATVQNIGSFLFDSCLHLESAVFENKLDSIPQGTFHCNTSLESVSFPKSVHKVGESAFANNYNLKDFDFSVIDTLGELSFYQCRSLDSVILGENISFIPYFCFYGCTNLKKLVLPEGLMTIGDWAFDSNTSLESLVIPDVTLSIGQSAFSFCKNLKQVKLGRNLKSIGFHSFAQTSLIESIDIPSSVEEIGDFAFSYNSSLKDITVHWNTPLEVNGTIFDNGVTLHVPSGTKGLYENANGWKEAMAIDEVTRVNHTPSDRHPERTVKRLIDGKIIIERGDMRIDLNNLLPLQHTLE